MQMVLLERETGTRWEMVEIMEVEGLDGEGWMDEEKEEKEEDVRERERERASEMEMPNREGQT